MALNANSSIPTAFRRFTDPVAKPTMCESSAIRRMGTKEAARIGRAFRANPKSRFGPEKAGGGPLRVFRRDVVASGKEGGGACV